MVLSPRIGKIPGSPLLCTSLSPTRATFAFSRPSSAPTPRVFRWHFAPESLESAQARGTAAAPWLKPKWWRWGQVSRQGQESCRTVLGPPPPDLLPASQAGERRNLSFAILLWSRHYPGARLARCPTLPQPYLGLQKHPGCCSCYRPACSTEANSPPRLSQRRLCPGTSLPWVQPPPGRGRGWRTAGTRPREGQPARDKGEAR